MQKHNYNRNREKNKTYAFLSNIEKQVELGRHADILGKSLPQKCIRHLLGQVMEDV